MTLYRQPTWRWNQLQHVNWKGSYHPLWDEASFCERGKSYILLFRFFIGGVGEEEVEEGH
ncbi:Uncharacterised protein [Vibrio cholerae]|uniref:Uncharacterized protein n=1 Tax=Vibrio cholerae TaxID=666 RepID=A0A655NXF6_VIBCL|nr:Uncharacterised protein [Vibrio cholerae]CRZ81941.1 Uncharacterised protein [Vibrio cholerae]CSA81910.1 Uncharacterised protein [Vibrio cholerae]